MIRYLLLAAIAGGTLAASLEAATVTILLSPNASASGLLTPGQFAVWAYTSGSTDNAGLASFSFSINGQTTIVNRSPQARFVDETGVGNDKYSGYSIFRSNGGTNLSTSGSFDRVTGDGIYRYGIGQTGGNLNTSVPAGYTATTSTANASYGTVLSSAGGTLATFSYFTGGTIPVLLATGTFATPPEISSAEATLFNTARDGTVSPATVVTLVGGFTTIPEPACAAVVGVGSILLTGRRRHAVSVGNVTGSGHA